MNDQDNKPTVLEDIGSIGVKGLMDTNIALYNDELLVDLIIRSHNKCFEFDHELEAFSDVTPKQHRETLAKLSEKLNINLNKVLRDIHDETVKELNISNENIDELTEKFVNKYLRIMYSPQEKKILR